MAFAKLIDDPMTDKLKQFKQEATDGLAASEALATDMDTATVTVSNAYADVLTELGTAWTSSDNAGTLANLTLINGAVDRLKQSATTDLAKLNADVKQVKEKIEQIEADYKKAQSYKPGGIYKNNGFIPYIEADGVAGDGYVTRVNDDEKIRKANEELPKAVQEAEKMIDAIADATGATKLGIIGNMHSGGSLGTMTSYATSFTQEVEIVHHPTTWTKILSGLIGMVEGALDTGEYAIDGLVMGVTSILEMLGIDKDGAIGKVLSGISDWADSDMISSLLDNWLEGWDGYDKGAREAGKQLGDIAAIYGCSLLGPVGNIVYGLSVFGEALQESKTAGYDMSDWKVVGSAALKGVIAAVLDSFKAGRIGLLFTQADVVDTVVSLVGEITGLDIGWIGDIAAEFNLSKGEGSGQVMMVCPNCNEIVAYQDYCGKCGKALPKANS